MRIFCIGDIVGPPGREAIEQLLPQLIKKYYIDLVIANAENASGGIGLTPATMNELLSLPIDVLTSGNHIWKYREINPVLKNEPRLLRPLNYPEDAPGRGYGIFHTATGIRIGIINLLGRIFMEPVLCPFTTAKEAITRLRPETSIILVEIHAEATSEKRALGWYLDGQISAIYGTHTHVATADEEILPGGTGYITDIGMTGPYQSVIGMKKEEIIQRFISLRPISFHVAKHDIRLCGVIFEINLENGKTLSITRIRESLTK